MTLHKAIEKLLLQKGRPMKTTEIALELNKNKWYQKKDKSLIIPYQILGRTKNYPNLFKLVGSSVSLVDKSIGASKKLQSIKTSQRKITTSRKVNSDEKYVIDLCDKVIGIKASRQHKFDFLRGDPNQHGRSVKLPVDAFYVDLKLVIEFREKQHTEPVKFFDKPDKKTVSGISRGEQRKLYDHRRRDTLPIHGIQLVEISYCDFNYDKQKRILRNKKHDIEVVKRKLKNKYSS